MHPAVSIQAVLYAAGLGLVFPTDGGAEPTLLLTLKLISVTTLDPSSRACLSFFTAVTPQNGKRLRLIEVWSDGSLWDCKWYSSPVLVECFEAGDHAIFGSRVRATEYSFITSCLRHGELCCIDADNFQSFPYQHAACGSRCSALTRPPPRYARRPLRTATPPLWATARRERRARSAHWNRKVREWSIVWMHKD